MTEAEMIHYSSESVGLGLVRQALSGREGLRSRTDSQAGRVSLRLNVDGHKNDDRRRVDPAPHPLSASPDV